MTTSPAVAICAALDMVFQGRSALPGPSSLACGLRWATSNVAAADRNAQLMEIQIPPQIIRSEFIAPLNHTRTGNTRFRESDRTLLARYHQPRATFGAPTAGRAALSQRAVDHLIFAGFLRRAGTASPYQRTVRHAPAVFPQLSRPGRPAPDGSLTLPSFLADSGLMRYRETTLLAREEPKAITPL